MNLTKLALWLLAICSFGIVLCHHPEDREWVILGVLAVTVLRLMELK